MIASTAVSSYRSPFDARLGLREKVLKHTEARWWIEHRDEKPSVVVRARCAELLDVYRLAFAPLSETPRS